MPRRPRTAKAVKDMSDRTLYKCLRCGREYETASGHFYKVSNSQLYIYNDHYCPLCRDCANEMFNDYSRRYKSDKLACILMCHLIDIPFYHSLYDSILANNNSFTMGIYLRLINCKQYAQQSFNTTLVAGELNKTPEEIKDKKEEKWTEGELRNKDEVIRIVGYDPFGEYDSEDRKYLFGELAKYMDDDITEDPYKLSQIIQIVNNNNQIRRYDLMIARTSPTTATESIKVFNDIKSKLVASNDKIAKENEISVKNRSNKDIGRNTLSFLMKDLREKDFEEAEANFYDQLQSAATQWAANMSFRAIKENTYFDENDQQEVFNMQREMITKLNRENDENKEKYRRLLIENEELRAELEKAKGKRK